MKGLDAGLNEDWTADVKGRMHRCRITNTQLAAECGYNVTYLSTVLNGNKAFESEEGKAQARDRILGALERLEVRIMQALGGGADAVPQN